MSIKAHASRGKLFRGGLLLALLACAALLGSTAAAVAADDDPETLQEIYARQSACAAVMAAAAARLHDPTIDERAAQPLSLIQGEAIAAGHAIGKAPDAVRTEISRHRKAIADHFAAASPEQAAKEESDRGKTAIACALVYAIKSK